MDAKIKQVQSFLGSNDKNFIIPVYQRKYNWEETQCKQLLADILEVARDATREIHFIGSIVCTSSSNVLDDIKEFIIIDGQQRITTLTLIYLAIYRFVLEIGDETRREKYLTKYLINKFDSRGSDRLKLISSESNDSQLKAILKGDERDLIPSNIVDNYKLIKSYINSENLDLIEKGLSKLKFVVISLDRDKDDPQLIFESLNSTGLALTQADLIRNYILIGLSPEEQKDIYENYWQDIENYAVNKQKVKESKVSEFIYDYLTLVNRKPPVKSKVYVEFKKRFPNTDTEYLREILTDIKLYAKYWNMLENPDNERDSDIRKQLQYINKLEVKVAYPFLMKVYDDYDNKIIDKTIFIKILELVQSFVWRRFIVRLPTSAHPMIFATLYRDIDPNNYLVSLEKSFLMQNGTQRFPRDQEVKDNLKVKDVYNIKTNNRTYLLERLENFNNNEPVIIEGNPDITTEHIFPQNPDPQWEKDLTQDSYKIMQESYLNSIANLTLSGNNGALGNKDFMSKRDMKNKGYRDSRLWLNKYLSGLDKWDVKELEERFEYLSKRFLEIWKIPNIKIDTNAEISIFEAGDPTYKKLEYAIFLDKKLNVKTISDLYLTVFTVLFAKYKDKFLSTDLRKRIKIQTEDTGLLNGKEIGESYFFETGLSSMDKFRRIKYALEQLNLKDALIIKYANDDSNK